MSGTLHGHGAGRPSLVLRWGGGLIALLLLGLLLWIVWQREIHLGARITPSVITWADDPESFLTGVGVLAAVTLGHWLLWRRLVRGPRNQDRLIWPKLPR